MLTVGVDIGSISAKAAAMLDGALLGSKVILTVTAPSLPTGPLPKSPAMPPAPTFRIR